MSHKRMTSRGLFFATFFIIYSASSEDVQCHLENRGKGHCVSASDCIFTKSMNDTGQTSEICGIINEEPMICCPLRLPGSRSIKECEKYGFIHGLEFSTHEDLLAKPKEFPHMALIGYKDGNDSSAKWLCSGSLISEQFVLSGAICAFQPSFIAKWIRLGELDYDGYNENVKSSDFDIIQIFVPTRKHPYKSYYKDIALFKLDRKVEFNDYIRPACLNTQDFFPVDQLVAVGWGQKVVFGDFSRELLTTELKYIDHDTCKKLTKNLNRNRLPHGILEDEHVCTGAVKGKNTCPTHGGGPLQVKIQETSDSSWYYSIVGITSFGTVCELENEYVVFTKVSRYVGWIEDIVWPDK